MIGGGPIQVVPGIESFVIVFIQLVACIFVQQLPFKFLGIKAGNGTCFRIKLQLIIVIVNDRALRHCFRNRRNRIIVQF